VERMITTHLEAHLLNGTTYTEDTGVVHTLLASFIKGNETAEAKEVQGFINKHTKN